MAPIWASVLQTALLKYLEQKSNPAVSERSAYASGQMLISTPTGFGGQHVAPLMPSFLTEHCDVALNLNDRVVDLLGEGIDVAISIVSLSDSSLVGAKLADNKRIVVASLAYIKPHGKPETVDDLQKHNYLAIRNEGSQRNWSFRQNDKVDGNIVCNGGQVLHDLALAGKGWAWRSMWKSRQRDRIRKTGIRAE